MEKIEEKRYVQRLLPHHGFQYTGTGMKMQWITFITFGGDGDKTPSKLTKAPHYICKNCPKNMGPVSKIRMFIRLERRAGAAPAVGADPQPSATPGRAPGAGCIKPTGAWGKSLPGFFLPGNPLPAGRQTAGKTRDVQHAAFFDRGVGFPPEFYPFSVKASLDRGVFP